MDALTKRTVLAGAAALIGFPAKADDRSEYLEYPLLDFFSNVGRGPGTPPPRDVETSAQIARKLPTDSYLHVMRALADLTDVGTTGELFNTRWKTVANPLIVRFFHDIGYKGATYPTDCTPWCAATVSWCLQRAGLAIPLIPASSQSFLHFGTPVAEPAVGDICVFTDVEDRTSGHVGLYISRSGDTVSVLGGNQSGQSRTGCGPGFRQSRVDVAEMPINTARDRRVGVHYLSAIVRPV